MEHIAAAKSQEFQKGTIVSHEYDFPAASFNLAKIAINGVYPEEGFVINKVSESIVHIISGSGHYETPGGTSLELEKDDELHILPNEPYRFRGTLEIIYAAAPKWTPAQAKIVD